MRPATAATSRRFSTSAPISIRVPRWATRATIPNQIARPHANAEYARQSRIDPTPKTCPPSFQKHLQGAGTNRTGGRQAQALQAYRASMREDGAELRLIRRACSRLHLDQIRPHGLAVPPLSNVPLHLNGYFFRLSHPASAAGADFNDEEAGDNSGVYYRTTKIFVLLSPARCHVTTTQKPPQQCPRIPERTPTSRYYISRYEPTRSSPFCPFSLHAQTKCQ